MNRAERRQMERKVKKGQPAISKNGATQGQHIITLNTPVGQIGAVPEDFQAMFQVNPLALEQLKSIMLNRALEAAHVKLKTLEEKQGKGE